MADGTIYWIWLAERLGAANKHAQELLKRFGSVFEIYRADAEQLTGFDRDGNEKFGVLADKKLDDAERILHVCDKQNIEIIPLDDERYPSRLRQIQDPPIVLYARGLMPQFDRLLCIGVVGTRKMSEYGCHSAYKISYGLASAGVITVSGMALGVDSISACAALAAGGHTVAVLGSGVDRPYPQRHRLLYEELVRRGTVLSEYSPGSAPTRYTFPQRNRIISGLCQGTFIVEGDFDSGAMITARDALVQGRELFALPGNVGSPNSNGTNALIRDGAHPVLRAEDILNEFLPLYGKVTDQVRLAAAKANCELDPRVLQRYGTTPDFMIGKTESESRPTDNAVPAAQKIRRTGYAQKAPAPDNDKKAPAPAPEAEAPKPVSARKPDGSEKIFETLDPNLRAIYAAMPDDEAVSTDALRVEGIGVGDVIAGLTILELKGLVTGLPGGMFLKK